VPAAAPSRRERLRAATVDEIKQVARRLLVQDGVAAVTLRAIAREMGMTAPGLYRYFASHDELLIQLCADLYHEVAGEMEAARDRCPPGHAATRLLAVSRAFRTWSVAHPAEFSLIFGSPVPTSVHEHDLDTEPHVAGERFAGVFVGIFAEIWAVRPFPIAAPDELDPDLRRQLDDYLGRLGADLPVGAAQVFLSCWVRLYGLVTLEVFGHLHFALTDVGPMFEAELARAAADLGVDYAPVSTGR
jgi:AcrR family transcriptional regulator